ncbi:MAG: hypothetical protein K6T78_12255 [Alicyclobacillus sp.]|nr:hypothetical protein [Alicyclobacillus sp.]
MMYYDVAVDSPPNAPILVSQPNFDATTAQTLTWQFSDPDAGDSQSAYQLQILDTAAGTNVVDTGKVASTASSYALAANTLTNGKQYQWRVTTWDSSGEQGPWSSYSTFTCAAAPTVTLTTPSSGGSVSTSSITAQWSYSDPASNAQQSFQVQLLASDDATVLWDSGTVNGTGNQMTVQYTLANTTTYHLRVRATSSKGITSAWADNSFTTSFTPPAQAGVTVYANSGSARVEITINNPTPSGTQPTVSYNDLYRRNSGTSSWTRIATQLPPSVTYNDYATASGQAYDYKVTSYGSNGTQIDSTVVSTSGITLSTTGLWVHDVQDPEGTIINLRYYNASNQTTDGSVPQSRQWTPTATSLQFAGRNRPVIEFGEQETFSLTYAQIVMLATDEQWPVLEQLIRVNKSTLCFRDGRGTCIFGCVLGYQETDLVFGNMVDLTLQQTAYSLSV